MTKSLPTIDSNPLDYSYIKEEERGKETVNYVRKCTKCKIKNLANRTDNEL